MKLSEMKQVLAGGGIQLTKSLGQNFLHDANQLQRIVDAARLAPSDKVLEIGPGLGPLTEVLLAKSGEVLAIEKDARLCRILEERLKPGSAKALALRLLHADALEYLRREPRDWTGWKLVANLPYSVASPLLVELAQNPRGPDRMVATLQIEVARRLMGRPAEPDYGVLTLLVQLDYEPAGWFKIPASCFFPRPEVDSACVTLERRKHPVLENNLRASFVRVVKRSFSQRRKMMLKLLKTDWPVPALEQAFARVGLPPQIRSESVSLERFAHLTRELAGGTASASPPDEVFDVVNERDEVIGQNTRREVHRLGLMHRAIHVLVYNARGEVFLQKRSMQKDRQPGLWDSSASGHVDSGEAYDACAVRELREELGLEVAAPPARLFKLPASERTDQEHVWVYRCLAEGPFHLHPGEIERGEWFSPESVSRWLKDRPQDFASAFARIWEVMREVARTSDE